MHGAPAGEESKEDEEDEDEGAFDVSKVKGRLAKRGGAPGAKRGKKGGGAGEDAAAAKKKKEPEKKPRQKVQLLSIIILMHCQKRLCSTPGYSAHTCMPFY
jgi:hypothetical protein